MIPRTTAAGTLPAGRSSLETVRLTVAGMTCASCVGSITRALHHVEGVDRVRVDLGAETVTVRRVHGTAPDAVLATALTEAGYRADVSTARAVPAHESLGLLERLLRRTS